MATLCVESAGELHGHLTRKTGPELVPCTDRQWFAVYTLPQNERSVARYLEMFQIETFFPACESVRRWKNRQRVKVMEALFPTYVFARIHKAERGVVLRSPGVRRIVGNHQGPIAMSNAEVEFLRSGLSNHQVEPYREVVVGQRVRIKAGSLEGLAGTLVRKKSGLRFVLTLDLIGQNAAVEVAAEDLEPLLD